MHIKYQLIAFCCSSRIANVVSSLSLFSLLSTNITNFNIYNIRMNEANIYWGRLPFPKDFTLPCQIGEISKLILRPVTWQFLPFLWPIRKQIKLTQNILTIIVIGRYLNDLFDQWETRIGNSNLSRSSIEMTLSLTMKIFLIMGD